MKLLSVICILFSGFMLNAQQKIDFVAIDTTWWSITNLNLTHFRNGDKLRNAKTREDWIECLQAGIPAYCVFRNDTSMARKYGLIYNWFAIADPRGLAPKNSRVANNGDFKKLVEHINQGIFSYPGKGVAGQRLRDSLGWDIGKLGANIYDFGILPGGYRNENGEFVGQGKETSLWVRDTLSYGVVTLGNAITSPYALIHGLKEDMVFQSDGKRTGSYVRIVIGEEVFTKRRKAE
ncbi:MAG: fibrobacter succinogenes major paralogous domain-containing protein [Bacteroidetes bacterium]|nr:fibrobacter succinogenes major paralogous domain-containing protein [Bacteroidota bacterium]MBM3425151.1 hypothetical protein [Bacteroidota bacterium]